MYTLDVNQTYVAQKMSALICGNTATNTVSSPGPVPELSTSRHCTIYGVWGALAEFSESVVAADLESENLPDKVTDIYVSV